MMILFFTRSFLPTFVFIAYTFPPSLPSSSLSPTLCLGLWLGCNHLRKSAPTAQWFCRWSGSTSVLPGPAANCNSPSLFLSFFKGEGQPDGCPGAQLPTRCRSNVSRHSRGFQDRCCSAYSLSLFLPLSHSQIYSATMIRLVIPEPTMTHSFLWFRHIGSCPGLVHLSWDLELGAQGCLAQGCFRSSQFGAWHALAG